MNDLRNKLKSETLNISIDENTLDIDISQFSVTFNSGQTKIKGMSLIFDDQGQLENRLPSIKSKNPNMKEFKKGKNGNIEWVLVIFY